MANAPRFVGGSSVSGMAKPTMQSSSVSGMAKPTMQSTSEFDEYSVRITRNTKKKFSVMKFNVNDKIDLSKWQQAKMERENNMKEFKQEEEVPTFGAGSEYGKERRQEARRKKYGMRTKNYKPEDQPWILKQGGKNGKRYKGKKEGGITENSSYFIFTKEPDGAFEAHPLDSWYNFTPIITYKTLNAEEAEEEFGRRDKVLNYFSIMMKKRLKNDEDGEPEEVKEKSKKSQDLRIMEDDEYQGLMSDDDDDDDSDDEVEKPKKSMKKGTKKKPGKKKKGSDDDEALEESDEGDFDGREYDYSSEASSDEEDVDPNSKKNDMKGLDQELSGEDESEEEEEQKESETPAEGEEANKEVEESQKKEELSSDSSSDDSDSDLDNTEEVKSALFIQKKSSDKRAGRFGGRASPGNSSGNSSRSGTPTIATDGATTSTMLDAAAHRLSHSKRKRVEDGPPSKRTKGSPVGTPGSRPGSSESGITEELVRRYLKRKPMTTKDLLHKLKTKKTGMENNEIVQKITDILRKLAPQAIKHKGKTHWFIKES
ncbi:general transcription factor IIF subunit 1-like [Glandiceps talaboti]